MAIQRGQRRHGGTLNPTVAVVATVLAAGLLGIALWKLTDTRPVSSSRADSAPPAEAATEASPTEQRPLVVYCAAALKKSVDAIARRYEQETGHTVQLQFGASQTLLANIEVSRTGDLYLPADDSYLDVARSKQLVAEQIPLARMQAVLAVPRGNPQQVRGLVDLLDRGLSLALANPDTAAISAVARRHLTTTGLWPRVEAAASVQKTTVTEIAADVGVGAADGAIVWDVVAGDFDGVEPVEDKLLEPITAMVAVAVLKTTAQPAAALQFARYLAAADRGLDELARRGFRVVAGDPWQATPELVLFAGSMLRPAVEATITEFEAREGVHVTRVYNGCGILVAEMKAGRLPDAYLACDREFMNQVRDDFPDALDLATNQLVILVPKGNPQQIRGLADLSREGLRVGIGHEKQCAMGWLTQRTFVQAKLQTEVMRNVVVQTPTGDMLVNQMRAGSLDAAVAYLSNAVDSGDFLDAIAIENLPCATAVQPFGIFRASGHKQLTARLLAALRSAASRERFLAAGFQWNGQEGQP